MKIIRLLLLTFFILITTNAFALEGTGVTLLSKSIEAPPGVTGKFVHINGPRPFGSATASAHANNASGKVNQPITATGSHSFSVTNNTKQNQVYSYRFSLTAGTAPPYGESFSISVKPGGSAFDSAVSYTTITQSTPGKWGILASTEVYGESSKRSSDNATLTVNK